MFICLYDCRYVGPDDSATRKSVSTNSTSLQQNRKENSNLPPRFATAKLAQQVMFPMAAV